MSTNLNDSYLLHTEQYLLHDEIRRRMRWVLMFVTVFAAFLFITYTTGRDGAVHVPEGSMLISNTTTQEGQPSATVADEQTGTVVPTRVAVVLWDEQNNANTVPISLGEPSQLCQNSGSHNNEVCLSGTIAEPVFKPAQGEPWASLGT